MFDNSLGVVRLFVSEDKMNAHLMVSSVRDGLGNILADALSTEDILGFLKENGIKAGIDEGLIKDILLNKRYDMYHVIATGKPPVNGRNGQYTFHFNYNFTHKPQLLPNGSVNYHMTTTYEQVKEGALIAEYSPATYGTAGYNVNAAFISAVSGKEAERLTGQGFTVSEDGTKFYSALNGKIEKNGNTIVISKLLEINNDVDLTTGDIIFDGDVVINGNILTGAMIKTTGNLTVQGNVEGAFLTSGGDMILRSGMQGGGRGSINCSGDLWGKFFEHTKIITKGDLHANSLMNCDSVCEGNVYIHDRHGIIVGGSTKCNGNISATVIGNMSEVKTFICAGVNDSLLSEIHSLENMINDCQTQILKHNQILEKLNSITKPTDVNKFNSTLSNVKESMRAISNKMNQSKMTLDQKLFLIETSSKAEINVGKYLYPGVDIMLNGLKYAVKYTFTNVTVKSVGGRITIYNN